MNIRNSVLDYIICKILHKRYTVESRARNTTLKHLEWCRLEENKNTTKFVDAGSNNWNEIEEN